MNNLQVDLEENSLGGNDLLLKWHYKFKDISA